MGKSVYEIVTESIIERLEKGTVPWRRPWTNAGAVSWDRQRSYRGINTMLLEPGEYATFKAVKEAGGTVKKGEKGHMVVFWKWVEIEDKKTGKVDKVPFLRYYKVFEINTQCEGLESKRDVETYEHDPIKEAEAIKSGFVDCPPIEYKPGRAYYMPSKDTISIPAIEDYKVPEEFYSTMFHEMVHSTGHGSRLGRHKEGERAAAFGSESYSKEELVAEIGAAMLCGTCGIDNTIIDNSASYIASWLRVLKGDSKLVVTAAAQAQKAADYILNKEVMS